MPSRSHIDADTLVSAALKSRAIGKPVDLPQHMSEDIGELDEVGLQLWYPFTGIAVGYLHEKVWQLRFVAAPDSGDNNVGG